jgi:hypothetical protein
MAQRRRPAIENFGRQLFGIATVATANLLTLTKGNIFNLTGTTTINHIVKTGWVTVARGTSVGEVILIFNGAVTVTHNAGSVPSNAAALALAGAANFAATAGDTLSLLYDSVTDKWREIGRTVI